MVPSADVGSRAALTPDAAGGARATTGAEAPPDCSQVQVSAAPLRRLTREQYDEPIRDLLSIEGHPSLGLVADEKLAAFYSNSVSPVSRPSVEQYRDATEGMAAAAAQGSLGLALVREDAVRGRGQCGREARDGALPVQFNGMEHNRLLVSLAQRMGVDAMHKFGTTDTKSGNLTGFV